ncbi:MAG TPA: hypothetical protein DCM45_02650 [Clostridiales bacterium]|nr:hypothetical protein [Clostridiales bacterium]
MLADSIHIRDPFILLHDGVYYLYGTDGDTVWQGRPTGFACYTSQDLVDWEGPHAIFTAGENFFADRFFWAPECHEYDGRFYLLTTLGAHGRKKGIYTLVADSPLGPFQLHTTDPLTPMAWCAIDGTLFVDDCQIPWLIFSHTFEDVPTGDMAAVRLGSDLKHAIGEPLLLFQAADAPWAKPVPFAQAEFGLEGDVYFTDGPWVHRIVNGQLLIIWSAWSDGGYSVGIAVSESGTIAGPWHHHPEKLLPGGGHGMLFRSLGGELIYTMHAPNETPLERPVFYRIAESGDENLVLV